MAAPALFDLACQLLAEETGLSELATRGTLRLTLKRVGITAERVKIAQMKVLLARVLPKELASRGVESAEQACARVAERIAQQAGSLPKIEAPDDFLRRTRGVVE